MEADTMNNESAVLHVENGSSLVCHPIFSSRINSYGIWLGHDPRMFWLPLLIIQISMISITTWAIYFILRPLKLPRIISKIMGGIILGPSGLGRNKSFIESFFPPESQMLLDTAGMIGVTFFLFIVGVEMDPLVVKKSGRKAVGLGISTVILRHILLEFFMLTFKAYIPSSLTINRVTVLSIMMSLTSFPVIAITLTELGMLNSDIGHLLMSTTMVGEIFTITFMSITLAADIAIKSPMKAIGMVFALTALVFSIIFVFRPISLWIIDQTPEKQPMAKAHIFIIMIGILVTAFVGEVIGQHAFFGPFILGLIIPAGPPLGSALVEKIESVVLEILLPLFFISTGLRVNVFSIHDWKAMLFIEWVGIIGCLAKIVGCILPSIYIKIPIEDALVFSLLMCSKGIMELFAFRIWKDKKLLDDQEYVYLIISMMMVTSICTRLATALYKPAMQYVGHNWRTIQHTIERSLEPCFLVCVHNEDNVPPIINLLLMSNISRLDPLAVYIIHLIKLVGRASPLLLPYKFSAHNTSTDRIMNAFRHYKCSQYRPVWLQPFIAISPHESMHIDVCSLALTKHVSLVITPFHKQPAVDGKMMMEVSGHAIQSINRNILVQAPCSVGILVNCRALGVFMLPRHHLYRLAVLFLGGPDDREALAYAAWMANNPYVIIYVTRCVPPDGQLEDPIEKKLDDEMVANFKRRVKGNDRVSYREEEVIDGIGTITVIRMMGDMYDLFMVGRGRETETVLTKGLKEWNNDYELGIIGEFLASTDYNGAAAVLVLQQQTTVGDMDGSQLMPPTAYVSLTSSKKFHNVLDIPG